MIGKVLAHYHILEKLGEGGMGTVWKAHDTHLDRFVALKLLPPEYVSDSMRTRRFTQEAKAASALNHPGIITVHDVAEAEGVQFIVMEFVQGKTLEELIGRKPLKLSTALRYAVQIADALAKAHSAGIIHRDLKPSNIMITDDGRVKVLDFGLAKLTESAPGDSGSTQTLTVAEQPLTEEGLIVGTASYMSPEQAEGKALDARSDMFSFGSVLYEMISGHRAFQGGSRVSSESPGLIGIVALASISWFAMARAPAFALRCIEFISAVVRPNRLPLSNREFTAAQASSRMAADFSLQPVSHPKRENNALYTGSLDHQPSGG